MLDVAEVAGCCRRTSQKEASNVELDLFKGFSVVVAVVVVEGVVVDVVEDWADDADVEVDEVW